MLIAAIILPLALLQGHAKLAIVQVNAGSGPAVKAGDRVTVDYTGTLTNGKKFDSSIGREPFTFIVGAGEVIKGWDQGLIGMKAGGERKLTIPSDLAYGNEGSPPDIPAKATLIFTIQLHKIESLKTQVLKKGSGQPVFGPVSVVLDYVGKLENGTVFDKGQLPLNIGPNAGVVPGFEMAAVGMKLGEKRRVTIPPSLGYGSRSIGPIPANSTLVFEVELVKVNR